MDVPLPLTRGIGGEPVVHQDEVGTQVHHRALGFRERAAVGLRGVARDDGIRGLVLEAVDGAKPVFAACLEHNLALAAVVGDRVMRSGLLVPLPPVRRPVAVVIAGIDRKRLAPGVDDEAVLIGVAVIVRTKEAALEIERDARRIREVAVHRRLAERQKRGRAGRPVRKHIRREVRERGEQVLHSRRVLSCQLRGIPAPQRGRREVRIALPEARP